MLFDFLFRANRTAHLKRATQLLEEAHMARIEHQAAAEHHSALARMYAERARRLESELCFPSAPLSAERMTDEDTGSSAPVRPQVYSLDGGRRTLPGSASSA